MTMDDIRSHFGFCQASGRIFRCASKEALVLIIYGVFGWWVEVDRNVFDPRHPRFGCMVLVGWDEPKREYSP